MRKRFSMPSYISPVASTVLLGTIVAACGTVTAHAQELVANGGFETGDFTDWTVTNNDGYTFVRDISADSGIYSAFFGNEPVDGNATVSQAIATTAGDAYTFSFALKSDGDVPSDFIASFGSDVVFTAADTPQAPYKTYSFGVVATGSSTVISFAGSDHVNYLNLDDVSVTPAAAPPPPSTPEPGMVVTGLSMFGMTGLGLVRGRMRRRK